MPVLIGSCLLLLGLLLIVSPDRMTRLSQKWAAGVRAGLTLGKARTLDREAEVDLFRGFARPIGLFAIVVGLGFLASLR
jgi:hypothetical protein